MLLLASCGVRERKTKEKLWTVKKTNVTSVSHVLYDDVVERYYPHQSKKKKS